MAKRRHRKPTAAVYESATGTTAAHVKTRDADFVAYDNLHVLITKEDDMWIAEGVEIDYAAEGDTIADVKRKFADGLALTIESNLRTYNSIQPLLGAPDPEVWAKYYDVNHVMHRHVHNQVMTSRLQEHLPFFDKISWIEKVKDVA